VDAVSSLRAKGGAEKCLGEGGHLLLAAVEHALEHLDLGVAHPATVRDLEDVYGFSGINPAVPRGLADLVPQATRALVTLRPVVNPVPMSMPMPMP
jgi:hypothetical protein